MGLGNVSQPSAPQAGSEDYIQRLSGGEGRNSFVINRSKLGSGRVDITLGHATSTPDKFTVTLWLQAAGKFTAGTGRTIVAVTPGTSIAKTIDVSDTSLVGKVIASFDRKGFL